MGIVSWVKQRLVPVKSAEPVVGVGTHRRSAANQVRLVSAPSSLAGVVESMRTDYQVAFCERIIRANTLAVPVSVSVENGDSRAERLAGALQAVWNQTVASMLDTVAYGRVAYEKSFCYAEGLHYPDKLEPLPFRDSRLRLTREGKFDGVDVKTKSGDWQPLLSAADSWWLAIGATANNPHGQSRFIPAAYEVWQDKRGAKENRRTATRKWALRGPIVRGPVVDTDEQTGERFDVLAEMRPAVDTWAKGGLYFLPNDQHPSMDGQFKYEVVQADLQGFDPNALNATIDRLDVEMARAFGISEQTIMEGEGHGTYGSITQKMLMLFALCEELLGEFASSFEKYVVEQCLRLNGFDEAVKISVTWVSLTNRPDAFVFEVVKLLLSNPAFIESVLSGGVDVRQLLEQAGLPATEQLEQTLLAAAQRLAAVGVAPVAGPGGPAVPMGEFGALGRRQWQNNRKAIMDVLHDLIGGTISEGMAGELLQSLGVPPERAAAFIADAQDGTVDDEELKEPSALAQVVIPRQGFKVPQASQVINAGLLEFDRLYAMLVDAMSKRASRATLNAIVSRIVETEAEMRIAGRVLGMLSPWQPRVNTYADGAAADETEPLRALADSPYKFPWIESAVEFLESQGVLTSEQFVKMATADMNAVQRESGIETPKRLASIQTKLAKAMEDGSDLRAFRKAIEGETALTRSQTETLYRTQTKRGYVAGFEDALKSPVVAEEFPAVLFNATPDPRVRDEHWDLDGVVVLRSDKRAYNLLRKAATDFNCILPGNTLVGSVVCGVRSSYAGQAVEIVADSGHKIRVTQGHPVLTADGWVSAGEINSSHQLVLDVAITPESGDWLSVDTLAGWSAQVQNEPTRVEDVFRSLSAVCGIERRQCVVGDFHGEAKFFHGDVDVVWSDEKLLRDIQSSCREHSGNVVLEHSLSADMGGADLISASCGIHCGPFQPLGFRSGAGLHSSGLKPMDYGSPGDSESLADLVDGQLAVEEGDNLVRCDIWPSAANSDHILALQPSPNCGNTDTKMGRQLRSTHLTRSVKLSRVRCVRHFHYSGEVYDFQTPSGLIMLNGVVISNCRCAMTPLSLTEAESRGIKRYSDLPASARAKYG